jgi:hypothetical protein
MPAATARVTAGSDSAAVSAATAGPVVRCTSLKQAALLARAIPPAPTPTLRNAEPGPCAAWFAPRAATSGDRTFLSSSLGPAPLARRCCASRLGPVGCEEESGVDTQRLGAPRARLGPTLSLFCILCCSGDAGSQLLGAPRARHGPAAVATGEGGVVTQRLRAPRAGHRPTSLQCS